MAATSNQPCPSLYVNNLNDKVQKEELRSQLYNLFSTYGKVIDVVALKSPKMKGQAFVVFSDLASATTAMRALEGMVFYDKPMHIDYAKSKSYATQKREDPNFVPPHAANASSLLLNGAKRQREEDSAVVGRDAKNQKTDSDGSDDEEMEIDEDDELPLKHSITSDVIPSSVEGPTRRLLCTNLPQEVTDSVLSVLLQSHDGYKSVQVIQSPATNSQGDKLKMAEALFSTTDLAATAQKALNGFSLKKGWSMSVAFI